jgi:stage II sporulation protein M
MKKKANNAKKKTNFLLNNYTKSWNYIKDSKKFVFIVIFLFLFSLILGYLYHPQELSSFILEYIDKILKDTQEMDSPQMIFFIFMNNLRVGFMGIIYGFLLGIPSLIFTFVNGYVVGFVSFLAVSTSGAGSLLDLLPHGIFELPAIFISFALGIKFGTFVFYKDKLEKFVYFFKESLRVFLFIIVPLLIIAAIIEGTLIFAF